MYDRGIGEDRQLRRLKCTRAALISGIMRREAFPRTDVTTFSSSDSVHFSAVFDNHVKQCQQVPSSPHETSDCNCTCDVLKVSEPNNATFEQMSVALSQLSVQSIAH